MHDNFEKPKHRERPAGIYITWTHLIGVFVVIAGLIGVIVLSASRSTPTIPESEPLDITSGKVIILSIDSAQGWQPTGLRLQQGQPLMVQYLQGDWSIFPGDGIRYTADGGAAACGAVDCVEPIPDYTKSGLIGRIGDGEPFPVGSYLETTAQYEGTLQLRVNDAGTHDNKGSITVRVSNYRLVDY